MPNRFRDPTLRKEYAAAAEAYRSKHRNLFLPDGSRCYGSGMASSFWRGFDGTVLGSGWDAASKKTLSYAYWRAGHDARAAATGNQGKA